MFDNFNKISNTLKTIKVRYFPNNQVEKDVYDILCSKEVLLEPTKLNTIINYTYDFEKGNIIKQIINENLTLNQEPNLLNNLINLLEYIVLNSDKIYVSKINNKELVEKITDIKNSYVYLENGLDRGVGIKRKTEKILWYLSDDDYLYGERKRSQNLKLKLTDKQYLKYGGTKYYYQSESRQCTKCKAFNLNDFSEQYCSKCIDFNNTEKKESLNNSYKYNIKIKPINNTEQKTNLNSNSIPLANLIDLDDFN